MTHYVFCDICEDPLDSEENRYPKETRCDECKLGMRELSERARRVVEHLVRRLNGHDDKIEETRDMIPRSED